LYFKSGGLPGKKPESCSSLRLDNDKMAAVSELTVIVLSLTGVSGCLPLKKEAERDKT